MGLEKQGGKREGERKGEEKQ